MQQAVVPHRLLCDFLVSPYSAQLRAEPYIFHLGHAFLLIWLGVIEVSLGPEIGQVMARCIRDLLLLPLQDSGSLCIHLVQFLQELVALFSLLLVELLDVVFDLMDAVKFESLRVYWVDELVHPVKEDSDTLLYLLIAH